MDLLIPSLHVFFWLANSISHNADPFGTPQSITFKDKMKKKKNYDSNQKIL